MSAEQTLNIKMVATSDLYGGSGLASYRLLQGLQSIGCSAKLFVQERKSTDESVVGPRGPLCTLFGKVLPYLDPLPKLAYPKRHRDAWSCNFLQNPCLPYRELNNADIIHLHWVGAGVVPIRGLSRFRRPLVWTLHDSWPFTGGCHLPYDCLGYESCCGSCPQLRSGKERDLSRLIWERKSQAWRDRRLTIVAPSSWLASAAKSSALFRDCPVSVIPNGLDIDKFSPINKQEARCSLGLPAKSRLILFSAMGGVQNWNKGGDLLKDILSALPPSESSKLIVVLCGNNQPVPKGYFPVECIDLGRVDEDEVKRRLYSSVDATVIPSRSESLGYVAMESMACGTPCVGFSVGGVPDLIDHKTNGFLAEPYSTRAFAAGISWLLTNECRRETLSVQAREKIVTHFCHIKVAGKYSDLYARVLQDALGGP